MKRAIKLAISSGFYALDITILKLMRCLRNEANDRFVIIYYHAVSDTARDNFARQMDSILRHAKVVPANYSGPLHGGRLNVAITFDDAFRSVFKNAIPVLKERSIPATIFVPSGATGVAPMWEMEGDSPNQKQTIMDDRELRALPKPLIMIGSHSISHPHLTQIAPKVAAYEILNSRRDLQKRLGIEVNLFAFPYGDYNEELVFMCKKAGYEQVFSIVPHNTNLDRTDYVRGRISVEPTDGPWEFFLKMSGAYCWMTSVSKLKQAFFRSKWKVISLVSRAT